VQREDCPASLAVQGDAPLTFSLQNQIHLPGDPSKANGGQGTSVKKVAGKLDLDKRHAGADPAALRKAIATLLAWDGMMDQKGVGATLYRGWRHFAEKRHVRGDGPPLALIDALAETVSWLAKNYGTSEVAYGELHRIRRGDRSWPVSGGESGGGQTLRAIGSNLEGKAFYGQSGQSWTQLVQFRRGAVRSWSATPSGESDDPGSPHDADQAEGLFSPGRLKPTWFQPAELEGNVESTKVLRRERQ